MSASTPEPARAGLRVRAEISDAARASVETGIPVLDHLVGLMARYASLDLALEVEPGSAAAEASAAGWALGEALHRHLRGEGAAGYGSISMPAGEALAHVALEASGEPLVVSNVDLSGAHVGGLAADVIGDFLDSVAAGAGLTLHVRLLEGDNPEHVLDAIFKALGAALCARVRTTTDGREMTMGKTVVRTEAAPAPFQGAPYSQAIAAGGFVFVSGQVALEPGHTELQGGTIGEQTEQVFANLRAILEAAGSGLDRLVKTTVYLQNLDDFAGMNEVYSKHVGDQPPARATFEVAALPAGALVEIEAVALASS